MKKKKQIKTEPELRLYDQIHINIWIHPDKELSKIDLKALDAVLVESFKTFIQEFRHRGLTPKLEVTITK